MSADIPGGAQAERKVRGELNKLPMDRFIVAHDIRFKYGNIDHLVIRDDGRVFLIETKSHRGVITVDGNRLLLNGQPFKKNPIIQITRAISWLRATMQRLCGTNCWFDAVLVFPFGSVSGQGTVGHVNAVRLQNLRKVIESTQASSLKTHKTQRAVSFHRKLHG